ncbi:hypothetical protein HMPREF1583_01354 [Gardnerella vaginalis JCP8151B]|nr:hypothetical protein HMPREF1583_01354 [Gardnerella vaginalis JCP8151B]EPI62392.1 hypothetical protein HMPREF1578_00007 [Gardnerella pickettii JCP8017B]
MNISILSSAPRRNVRMCSSQSVFLSAFVSILAIGRCDASTLLKLIFTLVYIMIFAYDS